MVKTNMHPMENLAVWISSPPNIRNALRDLVWWRCGCCSIFNESQFQLPVNSLPAYYLGPTDLLENSESLSLTCASSGCCVRQGASPGTPRTTPVGHKLHNMASTHLHPVRDSVPHRGLLKWTSRRLCFPHPSAYLGVGSWRHAAVHGGAI